MRRTKLTNADSTNLTISLQSNSRVLLPRNILVVPVLVDGTRMPMASELPVSLKPFALRNAIQVRNTNFVSDAEQLITKLREALALGRPEHTQGLVLLWFSTSMMATFLLT